MIEINTGHCPICLDRTCFAECVSLKDFFHMDSKFDVIRAKNTVHYLSDDMYFAFTLAPVTEACIHIVENYLRCFNASLFHRFKILSGILYKYHPDNTVPMLTDENIPMEPESSFIKEVSTYSKEIFPIGVSVDIYFLLRNKSFRFIGVIEFTPEQCSQTDHMFVTKLIVKDKLSFSSHIFGVKIPFPHIISNYDLKFGHSIVSNFRSFAFTSKVNDDYLYWQNLIQIRRAESRS